MCDDISKKPGRFVPIAVDPERDEEFRGPFYELRKRKVRFSDEIRIEHERLKESLWRYIRSLRFCGADVAVYVWLRDSVHDFGCVRHWVPVVFVSYLWDTQGAPLGLHHF
jgi:hypothetical protein